MDSYVLMKCAAVSGSPYFHIGQDEMMWRIQRKKGEDNLIEDAILDKIDSEKKVASLKNRMTPRQKTIAHLIEVGAIGKRSRFFKKIAS